MEVPTRLEPFRQLPVETVL